jgi:hypothetical protein
MSAVQQGRDRAATNPASFWKTEYTAKNGGRFGGTAMRELEPAVGVLGHLAPWGWHMKGLENRLAAIGFRPTRRGSECWRVERIEPLCRSPFAPGSDPAPRRALSVWLDRLTDRQKPNVYRIFPAAGSK